MGVASASTGGRTPRELLMTDEKSQVARVRWRFANLGMVTFARFMMTSRTFNWTALRNGFLGIALGAVAGSVVLHAAPSSGLWLLAGAAVAAGVLCALLTGRGTRDNATV